jgi:hypothetical protein
VSFQFGLQQLNELPVVTLLTLRSRRIITFKSSGKLRKKVNSK